MPFAQAVPQPLPCRNTSREVSHPRGGSASVSPFRAKATPPQRTHQPVRSAERRSERAAGDRCTSGYAGDAAPAPHARKSPWSFNSAITPPPTPKRAAVRTVPLAGGGSASVSQFPVNTAQPLSRASSVRSTSPPARTLSTGRPGLGTPKLESVARRRSQCMATTKSAKSLLVPEESQGPHNLDNGPYWDALTLTSTLRDSLCTALGQPRASWGSGTGASPPPRLVWGSPQPTSRDLRRLQEVTSSMMQVLVNVQEQLSKDLAELTVSHSSAECLDKLSATNLRSASEEQMRCTEDTDRPSQAGSCRGSEVSNQEPELSMHRIKVCPPSDKIASGTLPGADDSLRYRASSPPKGGLLGVYPSSTTTFATFCSNGNSPTTTQCPNSVHASPSAPTLVQTADVEVLHQQLRCRATQLEPQAATACEMDRVAEQLRERVKELEVRAARVGTLQAECSCLRTRVAELIAAASCGETIYEHERKKLLMQLQSLEPSTGAASPAVNVGEVALSPELGPSTTDLDKAAADTPQQLDRTLRASS